MDFFQAQDFFKQMYPEKKMNFEFDDTCHRILEVIYTNGNPNMIHHVECNKVKVNIDGMEPIYCPIQPHRFNTSWAAAKRYLNEKSDVHVEDSDLKNLAALKENDKPGYECKFKEMCEYTGLSETDVERKLKGHLEAASSKLS